MKKYINFISLMEVLLYFLVVIILINMNLNIGTEETIGIYFSMFYWIAVLIFNICYYTFDLLKKQKTPKVPIYSLTAILAYLISLSGMAFVTIKNGSYREFIKSANDYNNMTKKERIQSYLYYLFYYIALILIILFLILDDVGITKLSGLLLLLASLFLLYRIFMLYSFADKKEVNKNE